ncbi:hypothetical protein CAPTEDRAFT_222865 [Capitella teleta]|uniref:BIG2 domain-containing protein n=1 Tax=Capitella teleta TaxID=283909 RepID=R7U5Y8_CAPTE|nr:hypothetical protein CAPTEDRAFT_222865 [Capitella teleta]|eukprot:ELU01491.1 hypothetical protein CAPTEDRAFT_222865 [Capitella teleta]
MINGSSPEHYFNNYFFRRSTRPEIASVIASTGDPNGCSQKAIVSAVSRASARRTAIIIAQNAVTMSELRCDVIVDDISSIDIETTTKELYLDDSPEEFVLRGMNEEGDVFSSLEGMVFKWNLITDTDSGSDIVIPAGNILRFLTFVDSSYETLDYIMHLERLGQRGDRILISGKRTGSAKVSARIADSAYESVKEAMVRIVVIANIQLNPPVVHLLQYTTVKYHVELIKQGQNTEITMPSQQYYLELDDDGIGSLDAASSVVTGLVLGDTEIKLKDKNVNLGKSFREPSAGIHVVNSGYLVFTVLPGRSWVLQTDKEYEIFVDVYDKESNRIAPSERIRIEALFPDVYFDVKHSSTNGSYHIVHTLQKGFTKIDGKLDHLIKPDGSEYFFDPVIEGSQDAEIYDAISVTPKLLILPWTPAALINYLYPLKAVGGSGNYTWHTDVPAVASVSASGEIRTEESTGETLVTVADARNDLHYDTMTTLVLPPSKMEFLPSRVEVEVGSVLDLPLAVYGKLNQTLHTFNDCHQMPIEVSVNENSVFKVLQVAAPIEENSCANIQVMGQSQGHTEVFVSYRYLDIKLEATVTVAVYRPLIPVDPESLALVTPAASKEIVFSGGPQPWVLDRRGYYEKAKAENPDLIEMTPVKDNSPSRHLHVFLVVCTQLGEQAITLNVGNTPTVKNTFPASSQASITFACAEPRALRLIPMLSLPRCPLSAEFDDPFPLYSGKHVDLQVTVLDESGRRFDNFSSLLIDWSISDQSLATFVDDETVITDRSVMESGMRNLKYYKPMSLMHREGSINVVASISRYNKLYLNRYNLKFSLGSPIRRERLFNLVHGPAMDPAYLTVYNHVSNKASVSVDKGSGYFDVDYAEGRYAAVKYEVKPKLIKVSPQEEGTFTITAVDLCLDPTLNAKTSVFISDVFQINLNVVDKVEIHKEVVASVRVLDRQGQAIPRKYFNLMNLQPKIGSEVIAVRLHAEQPDDDETTALYVVRGMVLGRTNLQYTAGQKSYHSVSSQNKQIQVFPPLRLNPRNITLIIGAVFQVTASGGPQPESAIEFSMQNVTVASVDSSGLLDAQELGSTWVKGQAVGVDEHNGFTIYSEDEVEVHVVPLEGIRIWTPLKRIQTNTKMPMYAVGISENESPFSFGSALPSLSFHWSLSNKDVCALKPLFYKSGMDPRPEGDFSKDFYAIEAGHVTINLEVTPHASSHWQIRPETVLIDSVQIQVFEELQLIRPDICDGTLLITPNTETQLRTNRDGSTAKISYKVVDHLQGDAEPLVTVSRSGQVLSGSRTGQATLLVISHEESGVNQSVVVEVKVKPISYLMINSDTVIHTKGSKLISIPTGTTLHLSISFHDDVGHTFYATSTNIQYRPNRFDLLQLSYGADNNTLVARATNEGTTVLKVWDRQNPQTRDFVSISVGEAILPDQAVVTLGAVLCFSSPLVTPAGHPGSWLSSSQAVLVDEKSGIGLASQTGTALITYTVSMEMTTKTEVTVAPVEDVTLKNDNIRYLTNVVSKHQGNSLVVSMQTADRGFKTNLHGANCSDLMQLAAFEIWRWPFRCELTMTPEHPHVLVSDLLKATSAFNPLTGQYQCLLQQSVSQDLSQLVSSLEASVEVRAVIPERDGQPEVTSNAISFPFLPAFFLLTPEVQLSNLAGVYNLRVSAGKHVIDDLKVTASDGSLLEVQAVSIEGHVAQFPIVLQHSARLWDRQSLDTSVEIHVVSTGQRQVVPVRIQLIGNRDDPNNAYHAWMGQKYQAASNQSGVFLSPQSGGSPFAQSPSNVPASPWNSPLDRSSASPTKLWSVDHGPYDTSSLYKRSPMQRSPTH